MLHPAAAIADDLDLDMAGAIDEPLGVDAVVTKGERSLTLALREARRPVIVWADHPHAAAATSGNRLDDDGRTAVLGPKASQRLGIVEHY